jgi:hypothetical protein
MKWSLAAGGAILILAFAGCAENRHEITQPPKSGTPTTAEISGTVTMPDGSRVWMAKVVAGTEDSTFTDSTGVYHLNLPLASDTLTIYAQNGFTPGFHYGEICSGSIRACPDGDRVVNIVLVHCEPI